MSNFLSKKEIWLPIVVLIIVGAFIYSFNLNNSLFWDDDDWIVNNNFVHTISWDNVKFWFTHDVLAGVGLKSNYFRPFLFFTFALNYIISGIKPFVYHLFSNLIHIVNGILVFLLLKRFDFGASNSIEVQSQKSPRLNLGTLIAFLTALIFIIHPLQTEAIAYISGRGDALVTFFMLFSLFLWITDLRSRYDKTVDNRLRKSVILKSLSLIALVLALLSRETAIIFPFLTLAFYVSFMSSSRFDLKNPQGRTFLSLIKQGLIKTWPYFAIVLVYGILRLTVLNFQNTLNFYIAPNIYSENLYVRMFTFLPVLWEYLRLLVVPVGLHMERSAVVYTSLFQWPVWLVAMGLVGLLVWLRYLYKKALSIKLKAESYRVWFFGVSLFFIAIGPVSGVTPINALIYEHWLYLPMVGFWLIFAFYLVKLFDFLKSKKIILAIGLTIYLSFFAYQSIQRNILWGNPKEFYKNILMYEPNNTRINNNLGALYYDNGDLDNAEMYYLKSAKSGDAFAQPYYNLGSIAQSRGDVAGAIEKFEKAIEIDPNFYYPYQNLTVIYAQQGDFVKAVTNIEKLKLLIPGNPRVYYNSALVYAALNNREKALADLKEGLKHVDLDPETGKLINDLIQKLQK